MKIFWPVENISTEELLDILENFSTGSFWAGVLIGMSSIVLLNFESPSETQELITGICITLLMAILLVLHIHIKRKILPELNKRLRS